MLFDLAANGIMAQRYLAAHGITDRQLAELVVERWAAAVSFGGVEIDAAPNADAVLASGNGAAPLTEMMFARPVDGAVAVLLGRDDIARRASRNPVFVTGMGSSMDGHALPRVNTTASRPVGRRRQWPIAKRVGRRTKPIWSN